MVQLPTVSREQLRQARNQSARNNQMDIPFAKTGLVDSIARNITTAELTGRDPVAAAQAATQSFQRTGGGPEIRQSIESRMVGNRDTELAVSIQAATESLQQAAENAKNEITFGDQVGAAWDLFSGTSAIIDLTKSWNQGFEFDPQFDYEANRTKYEEGLSWDAVQHLRENARSAEHAAYLREEQLEFQRKEQILSAHGTGKAVLAGLVGGAIDPAGWVAGLGVMKGMQIAGYGARASFVAGNTARGVGLTAVEGAAGNLAVEAMLDVAGRRVDAGDYAISAGFGGAFGLALSPLAYRGAQPERARVEFEAIAQRGHEQNQEIYETAAANLGANVTPEALNMEIERLYRAEGQNLADIRLTRPDPSDRWMGETEAIRNFREDGLSEAPGALLRDVEDRAAATTAEFRTRLAESRAAVSAAEARNDPDALLRAQEDLAETEADFRRATAENRDLESRYNEVQETDYDREIGVDGMLRTDPLRAKMIADTYAGADEWVANNPIDEARVNDVISRLGNMGTTFGSTAQRLFRTNHPVARKIAGTLLESTTGAAGRRPSAAISKVMNERVYMGEIEQIPHLYRIYRRSTGGSGIKDWWDQKHYKEFNDELTAYRLAASEGENLTGFRPEIAAASERFDKFYNITRRDQIAAGTPGHEALPVADVKGYFNHQLSAEAVGKLSNAGQRALRAEYKRQLTLLWDDPDFAEMVAARIVEHARIASAGGKEIPVNLYSKASAPLLRNALENTNRGKLKLEAPEIEAMIKRITTKGPAFTKARLDLDKRASIRDPETGETFKLSDMYEKDQMKLALNYARRVSGEVALAKHGIQGEEGLNLLRDALTVGRDGERLRGKELEDATTAFDQIAAEFLGRPYGDNKGWFRAADNLRLLVASSRLGGMAFTQLGEYANAIPALGVAHTMAAIKSMPRLINEVRTGKSGPMLRSMERVGGEFGTDYKVNFPFQNLDDTFVHGREQMGAATRLIRSTSNAVPFLNGWHYVHAAQVRGMAEQILHKAVKQLKDPKMDTRMLDDMGITDDIRKALKRDINRIAKFDKNGDLIEFDIEGFTDPRAAHAFVQAVHRGSKQIIQGTFIGETGKWAHNDLLRILTQFRTFGIVSTEKQWTRVAAIKGGWKTFGLLMGAMSFALPIHLARVQLASIGRADREEYLEQQLHVFALGRAVMNYASLSGLASDLLDLGAAGIKATEGVTGVDTGLDLSGVRGISSGDFGAIIPALGYGNSVLRALTSGDPEAMLRNLPGGNMPYVVPILNALKNDGSEDWDLRN